MLKTSFTIVEGRRRPAVLSAVVLLFAVSYGCGDSSSPSTPTPTPAPPPTTPSTPTTPTTPTPEPTQPDTATYTFAQPVRLIGSSTSTTTPAKLPDGVNLHGELAMFLHSRDWMPFEEGQPATDGLKILAETGDPGAFLAEAEAASGEARARTIGELFVFLTDPSIRITIEKPCMSYAQWIEPSPDWFVGWSTACATDKDGRWLDTVTTRMIAFDAGTADGGNFERKRPGADTEPRWVVSQLDLRQHLGIDDFPAVFQRITATRKTE